jgi:hypothetical protein
MGEKLGINLKIIHHLVYRVISMIKSPTTTMVHATVNPMTFVFTVKVV